MGLLIEDEALQAKAKRLAELTGTSITGAVSDAIERRLAELESREAEVRRRSRRMLEIGRRFAELPPPGHGAASTGLDELFYDEDGLPK